MEGVDDSDGRWRDTLHQEATSTFTSAWVALRYASCRCRVTLPGTLTSPAGIDLLHLSIYIKPYNRLFCIGTQPRALLLIRHFIRHYLINNIMSYYFWYVEYSYVLRTTLRCSVTVLWSVVTVCHMCQVTAVRVANRHVDNTCVSTLHIGAHLEVVLMELLGSYTSRNDDNSTLASLIRSPGSHYWLASDSWRCEFMNSDDYTSMTGRYNEKTNLFCAWFVHQHAQWRYERYDRIPQVWKSPKGAFWSQAL